MPQVHCQPRLRDHRYAEAIDLLYATRVFKFEPRYRDLDPWIDLILFQKKVLPQRLDQIRRLDLPNILAAMQQPQPQGAALHQRDLQAVIASMHCLQELRITLYAGIWDDWLRMAPPGGHLSIFAPVWDLIRIRTLDLAVGMPTSFMPHFLKGLSITNTVPSSIVSNALEEVWQLEAGDGRQGANGRHFRSDQCHVYLFVAQIHETGYLITEAT